MPLLEDVLNSVGVNPSLIPDIIANKDGLVLDDITSAIRDNYANKLLDDADFVGKISKEKLHGSEVFKTIFGEGQSKATGILLKQYKEYHDITDEDLTEDQRKDFIKNASAIVKSRLSKVNMDATAKGLESENQLLRAKVSDLEAAGNTLAQKLESEFNEKLSIREQDFAAQRLLIPVSENIKFGLTGSLNEVIAAVRNKFAIVAANGVIELKDKLNPAFTAKIDGKPITYEDALIAEIKAYGAWVDTKTDAGDPVHIRVPVSADKGILHSITGLSASDLKRMEIENS